MFFSFIYDSFFIPFIWFRIGMILYSWFAFAFATCYLFPLSIYICSLGFWSSAAFLFLRQVLKLGAGFSFGMRAIYFGVDLSYLALPFELLFILLCHCLGIWILDFVLKLFCLAFWFKSCWLILDLMLRLMRFYLLNVLWLLICHHYCDIFTLVGLGCYNLWYQRAGFHENLRA